MARSALKRLRAREVGEDSDVRSLRYDLSLLRSAVIELADTTADPTIRRVAKSLRIGEAARLNERRRIVEVLDAAFAGFPKSVPNDLDLNQWWRELRRRIAK